MRNYLQNIIGKNVLQLFTGHLKIFHAITCIQGPIPSGVRTKCRVGAKQDVAWPKEVIGYLYYFSFKTCIARECCVNIDRVSLPIETKSGATQVYPWAAQTSPY